MNTNKQKLVALFAKARKSTRKVIVERVGREYLVMYDDGLVRRGLRSQREVMAEIDRTSPVRQGKADMDVTVIEWRGGIKVRKEIQ